MILKPKTFALALVQWTMSAVLYATGLVSAQTEQVGAATVHVMVTWPGAPVPPFVKLELAVVPRTPPAPTVTDTVEPGLKAPEEYVIEA